MPTGTPWKTASLIYTHLELIIKGPAYSRANFNAPEAKVINEVKSTKEPGLCFKCGGPYFQSST